MTEGSTYNTPNVLDALRKIREEKLSGSLFLPYKSVPLALACDRGALTALNSPMAQNFYLPYLQANVPGFTEPTAVSGDWYPLLPAPSLKDAALRFLCKYLNNLFEPELERKFMFQASAPPSGGYLPLDIPALVCRFLGTELAPAALDGMQWDLDHPIQVAPDFMGRIRRDHVPLTPQQAYLLTRLHDGLTLREFSQSCGVPEEQTQRAMLVFSFFRLTEKGQLSAGARRPPAPTHPASAKAAAARPPVEAEPGIGRRAPGGGDSPENGRQARSPEAGEAGKAQAPPSPGVPDPDAEKLASPQFDKGKEAMRNRKFQEAGEFFQEAARLAPHVSACHFMWGKVLAMNPLTQKQAEEILLKAAEMKPDQVEYQVELARLYERIGLPQRAYVIWRQALALDPKHKEAAGRVAELEGKSAKAKNLLNMDMKDLFRSFRNRG